jgi:hypothetical protein
VEAILDGRQPKGLKLAEMLGNGPLVWEEQRSAWVSLEVAALQLTLAGLPGDRHDLSPVLVTRQSGRPHLSITTAIMIGVRSGMMVLGMADP